MPSLTPPQRLNAELRKREEGRERLLAQRPLTALVTGASSGIGKAMVELLADRRHDLVLVARREPLLQEVAEDLEARHGVRCTVLTADLSDPAAPADLVARIEERDIEVDVLVNNAGYTMDGHLLSYDWEQHRAYQQVMALTPAELTYRLLGGMVRRGFGQVMNVASAAALMPGTPFNSLYGPCKHHMTVLTRSLQFEYGAAGVTFSVCFPPPVSDTGIVDNTSHGQAWARFGFLMATPRQCAELAYAAVQQSRTTQPIGPTTRGLGVMNHLLPADGFGRWMGAGVAFLSKEQRVKDAQGAGIH